MSESTAGKGPGLVMRASNHSGALRVVLVPGQDRAVLEVQEWGAELTQIGLSIDELRALGRALFKVATALQTAKEGNEVTERYDATRSG